MLKRQTRERREYLFKKAQETQAKEIAARKRRVKDALTAGKAIPTDLRGSAAELRDAIKYDDENTDLLKTHEDDEYARAGVTDPKILLTTSRDPSSRLKQFVKEVRLLLPNSQRMNRGNHVIKDIVQACRSNEITDLVIVQEHRGEPDGLVISHMPYGPTVYFGLSNTVMRHDVKEMHEHKTVSEEYPHLVFNNMNSALGNRITNVLKYLFPVPKEDSHRIMTFSNDKDYISFRHHVYTQEAGNRSIKLAEMGPRFEMKVYQIKRGTIDQTDAENEWVSRQFMRTAKKKERLA